jgi:hypothetical protein
MLQDNFSKQLDAVQKILCRRKYITQRRPLSCGGWGIDIFEKGRWDIVYYSQEGMCGKFRHNLEIALEVQEAFMRIEFPEDYKINEDREGDDKGNMTEVVINRVRADAYIQELLGGGQKKTFAIINSILRA